MRTSRAAGHRGCIGEKQDAREQFAMAQFLNMSDAQKLSRKSFERETRAGAGASGRARHESHGASRRPLRRDSHRR